ncbi:Putative ribonuclease H protein At1g65750 [Linum perenne]
MALLAKQGWNLQTNPITLVSKIYKAKYYPRGDFLSAEQGANPSLVWQSIWQARMVTHVNSELLNLKVCDLWILGTKHWDVELIEELFERRDCEAITTIQLVDSRVNDRIIWHFGKRGEYTVKSGYRLWAEEMSSLEAHKLDGPWTKIWDLHTPPKMRIMVWRLVSEIVPSRATLRRRHIDVPDECAICGADSETYDHLFRDCQFAKDCWRNARLERLIQSTNTQQQNFHEWLTDLLNTGSPKQLEQMAAILWSVWREQNWRVWQNESKPSFVVARLAIEGLTDWQNARQAAVTPNDRRAQQCRKWHPPAEDFLKCNVDCARFENQN